MVATDPRLVAAGPWLLVPGDPLPALPLAGQVWRAQAFAGNWGVVIVGDRLDPAALEQIRTALLSA